LTLIKFSGENGSTLGGRYLETRVQPTPLPPRNERLSSASTGVLSTFPVDKSTCRIQLDGRVTRRLLPTVSRRSWTCLLKDECFILTRIRANRLTSTKIASDRLNHWGRSLCLYIAFHDDHRSRWVEDPGFGERTRQSAALAAATTLRPDDQVSRWVIHVSPQGLATDDLQGVPFWVFEVTDHPAVTRLTNTLKDYALLS